jgi:hypothetical protein
MVSFPSRWYNPSSPRLRCILAVRANLKRVDKATRELGKEAFYLNHNKMLSKLAHPTALMVHSPKMLKPSKGFRNAVFDVGVGFAIVSFKHIRDFTNKTFPTNPSPLHRVLPD